MSARSAIEWTDATFNPWWGCARVSAACDHCYAEAWAKRTGHDVWGKGGDRRFFGDKHWNEPLTWNRKAEAEGRPWRVFCASMADVFEDHPALPPHRERLWNLIGQTPWLTWLLLTKRPENVGRMIPWADVWPENVWLGTTVENQRYANIRIPHLVKHPAAVRFLSCEPLLERVDLRPWLRRINPSAEAASEFDWDTSHRIDWVIAGGESGPGARPMHPTWARALRDECDRWGVPFLFKQWGDWAWTYGGDPLDAAKVVLDNGDGAFAAMWKVGKKKAGRVLDGRTHDDFPALVVAS